MRGGQSAQRKFYSLKWSNYEFTTLASYLALLHCNLVISISISQIVSVRTEALVVQFTHLRGDGTMEGTDSSRLLIPISHLDLRKILNHVNNQNCNSTQLHILSIGMIT